MIWLVMPETRSTMRHPSFLNSAGAGIAMVRKVEAYGDTVFR